MNLLVNLGLGFSEPYVCYTKTYMKRCTETTVNPAALMGQSHSITLYKREKICNSLSLSIAGKWILGYSRNIKDLETVLILAKRKYFQLPPLPFLSFTFIKTKNCSLVLKALQKFWSSFPLETFVCRSNKPQKDAHGVFSGEELQ